MQLNVKYCNWKHLFVTTLIIRKLQTCFHRICQTRESPANCTDSEELLKQQVKPSVHQETKTEAEQLSHLRATCSNISSIKRLHHQNFCAFKSCVLLTGNLTQLLHSARTDVEAMRVRVSSKWNSYIMLQANYMKSFKCILLWQSTSEPNFMAILWTVIKLLRGQSLRNAKTTATQLPPMTEMWLLNNCLKMLQDTYRRYIRECRRDSETKPKTRHEQQSVAASRGHEEPLSLPGSRLNLNSRNHFWSAKQ